MIKQQLIYDDLFAHAKGMSWHTEPKDIKWVRPYEVDINEYHTAFFTDHHLKYAEYTNFETKIAILVEPTVIHPFTYEWIVKNEHIFDHILTHNLELVNKYPKYLYAPIGAACSIDPNEMRVYNKNKLLSIIASNKRLAPGHKLRHEIVKKFPQIDKFGNGYLPIDNKITGLRDYAFSLAISNNNEVDGYFTEILLDCFACGTIPIWWGCKNIGNYFDTNGIIIFEDIEELNEILPSLSYDLYESKKESIINNFTTLMTNYMCVEDWIYKKYQFLFGEK